MTDIQTDEPRYGTVAIGGIAFYDPAYKNADESQSNFTSTDWLQNQLP